MQLPEAKKELSDALEVQDEIDQLKEAIKDMVGSIKDLKTRVKKKNEEINKLESGSSYRSEKQRKFLQRKILGLERLKGKIKEDNLETEQLSK